MMQKFKTTVLLFLMGIILFPWQTVCLAHPFGEEHHHEGKSPCELRKEYKGDQPVFWPPMDCKHEVLKATDFHQPQLDKLVLVLYPFTISSSNFEFERRIIASKTYLFPPEPNCRSATLISDKSLRGPPLV